MQIVFLVNDIHLGGGGERVTVNLANYFDDKGYKIKIVSITEAKANSPFQINKSIGIDYLGINPNSFNFVNKAISVLRVNSYFKKFKTKTIILGIGNYPSLLLCFIPKKPNVKTVGCQHLAYSGIKNLWAVLRKIFFHRLDRVVSLTNRDLPKYKKLNKNPIVIPNSITALTLQTADLTNKRLLFVGRMVYEKGYDLLIKMLKKLFVLQPDWDIRIVGDGPLRDSIVEDIELSGLRNKVTILSSTTSIVDEYLNSSIFLMTSRTEGLPMVLLEAQSCGLPIVSFDCETGPSEIVTNDKNGYLISDFNIDAMVEKLDFLCSDIEKRVEFGKNGRENIVKFSPEAINKRWEELFEEVFQ